MQTVSSTGYIITGNIQFINIKKRYTLPVTIRRNVASVIKDCILNQNKNMYDMYWGDTNNVIKPFTFCTYIPNGNIDTSKNVFYTENNNVYFNILSNNLEFIKNVYTGIIQNPDTSCIAGETTKLSIKYMNTIPKIHGNAVIFNVISPIVLYRQRKFLKLTDTISNTFETYYKVLHSNVNTLCKTFLGYTKDITADDCKFQFFNTRTVCIPHYETPVIGTMGQLFMQAPNDILNLVNTIGIGVRRSQGFGVVSTKRQIGDNYEEI